MKKKKWYIKLIFNPLNNKKKFEFLFIFSETSHNFSLGAFQGSEKAETHHGVSFRALTQKSRVWLRKKIKRMDSYSWSRWLGARLSIYQLPSWNNIVHREDDRSQLEGSREWDCLCQLLNLQVDKSSWSRMSREAFHCMKQQEQKEREHPAQEQMKKSRSWQRWQPLQLLKTNQKCR